jgi:hypothetical protein
MVRNIGVVAVVALLVGATGATAAQVITGAQIKNSSITGKDIKNKSLTAQDFRGSVRGPQGAPGAQGGQGTPGAQGAQGVQGAAGQQGLPGAANTTVRVGPGGAGSDVAFCQPGERVVGGGGFSPELDGYLWASAPVDANGDPIVDDGTPPGGWAVSASIPESAADPGVDVDSVVQAYVICAI